MGRSKNSPALLAAGMQPWGAALAQGQAERSEEALRKQEEAVVAREAASAREAGAIVTARTGGGRALLLGGAETGTQDQAMPPWSRPIAEHLPRARVPAGRTGGFPTLLLRARDQGRQTAQALRERLGG